MNNEVFCLPSDFFWLLRNCDFRLIFSLKAERIASDGIFPGRLQSERFHNFCVRPAAYVERVVKRLWMTANDIIGKCVLRAQILFLFFVRAAGNSLIERKRKEFSLSEFNFHNGNRLVWISFFWSAYCSVPQFKQFCVCGRSFWNIRFSCWWENIISNPPEEQLLMTFSSLSISTGDSAWLSGAEILRL